VFPGTRAETARPPAAPIRSGQAIPEATPVAHNAARPTTPPALRKRPALPRGEADVVATAPVSESSPRPLVPEFCIEGFCRDGMALSFRDEDRLRVVRRR